MASAFQVQVPSGFLSHAAFVTCSVQSLSVGVPLQSPVVVVAATYLQPLASNGQPPTVPRATVPVHVGTAAAAVAPLHDAATEAACQLQPSGQPCAVPAAVVAPVHVWVPVQLAGVSAAPFAPATIAVHVQPFGQLASVMAEPLLFMVGHKVLLGVPQQSAGASAPHVQPAGHVASVPKSAHFPLAAVPKTAFVHEAAVFGSCQVHPFPTSHWSLTVPVQVTVPLHSPPNALHVASVASPAQVGKSTLLAEVTAAVHVQPAGHPPSKSFVLRDPLATVPPHLAPPLASPVAVPQEAATAAAHVQPELSAGHCPAPLPATSAGGTSPPQIGIGDAAVPWHAAVGFAGIHEHPWGHALLTAPLAVLAAIAPVSSP